jgi:hypothetical protein
VGIVNWLLVATACMVNAPTDCKTVTLAPPASASECATNLAQVGDLLPAKVMGSEWTEYGCAATRQTQTRALREPPGCARALVTNRAGQSIILSQGCAGVSFMPGIRPHQH